MESKDKSPTVDTKKSTKQPTKESAKQSKQQLSMLSCSAHNDNFFKLAKPSKNTNTCKSCGFKLSGATGYLACSSKGCGISLCSSCKVCKNNHFLGKVFSLKNYQMSPLYSKNKFNCAACKQQSEVTADGVYHCGTCQYTLCMECIRHEERLWK